MLDDYAPDYSLKMGEGLAYESVELRRRRRLPLRKDSHCSRIWG
jgi:hypothetical protein